MTTEQGPEPNTLFSDAGLGTGERTVQILVEDVGNRTAIERMLEPHVTVETDRSLRDADLYLVEDRLLQEYRDELCQRSVQGTSAFCPVVLIRRESTTLTGEWLDDASDNGHVLIDDVIDAPIDPRVLIRRLQSLLARRDQSKRLLEHVWTLEDREQELRRFERGVESTGNAIVMTDTAGKIEYVNPAFEVITGYRGDAVHGETPRIFQPGASEAVFDDEFWQTMTNRGEWEGEFVIERQNAARAVVTATVTAIRDATGGAEGFVIAMSDVTDRIHRQQELEAREGELDLLRQVLTRYLRHNLRNDLNVILAYAELLMQSDDVSTETHQWAEKILKTTNRLMGRSDTARMYAKLLVDDDDWSTHSLSPVVSDVVNRLHRQFPEIAVETDIQDECQIFARDGITEALWEILENGAVHNDSESPSIHIRVQELEGPRIVIEDNGPGIPELERLTLERGEETPLSHTQGIGLWLSKWVIEGSGGNLTIETSDTGTRVTISFPPAERTSARGTDIPSLKEREQRLQTIIARVTDAIIEVDKDWQITFIDKRAEEILDVSSKAVLGNSFWDVFEQARDTRFETVYRDAMETRTSAGIVEYYSGIDGWIDVQVYPEFDGGLSFYFRDVTDQNEREQALEERIKELSAIYRTTRIFEGADFPLTTALGEFVESLPFSFQHPEKTAARLIYGDIELSTADFEHRDVRLSTTAELADGTELRIEVVSLPDSESGETAQFLLEEQELLETLAVLLKGQIERQTYLRETQRTEELLTNAERLGAVGAWEANLDTGGVFWTPGTRQIYGVSEEFETTVASALEFVHPVDRDAVENELETTRETGDPFEIECRICTQAGEERWVLVEGHPVADAQQEVIRGYIQDVTDRKEREKQFKARTAELRKKTKHLDAILEHTTRPLFMKSRNGEYILTNRAYQELFDLEDEEIVGRTDFDLHPEEMASTVWENDQQVLETGTAIEAEETILVDGEERIYLSSKVPIYLDTDRETPDAVFGIATDVTSRRVRQREISEINEQLDQFASVVSHDLRNPLNVAQLRLDLAKGECHSEHLEPLERSLDRIERIIEDVLWLARTGQVVGELSPIRLTSLIKRAWEQVDTGTAEIEMDAIAGKTISADDDRLLQLFENLFRNAIEHGDDSVTVRVGAMEEGFYVEDTGPGIPPEDRSAVFETGFSTSNSGTGFGLSIVQEIVTGHGWEIAVTAGADGGARFEITGVESLG